MVSADVEARLIIARSKERAAARSMQDRGKNKGAREAARTDWAQARLQAENLERGIQIPRSTSRRVPPLPPSVSPASSVRPVSKKEGTAKKKVGRASTRGATADTLREDKGMSGHGYVRHMNKGGHPAPLGDPASGVVLVVEQPVGIRVREALKRSLRVVGLPKAYVTYASTGLLGEALRSTEPRALVAIGPGAVRDIAAGGYPLVCQTFSEAEPGVWFTWTKATMGLLLPSLIPALDDEAAKREFWRGFLNLRNLAPTQ